jgi:hypothetical protein
MFEEVRDAQSSGRNVKTAVIDKSVYQRIAELPSAERREIWEKLSTKFQIVVPFVLVEEVMVNLGQPGPIPRPHIETMFKELIERGGCWMDDEPGWIFEELVQGNRSQRFKTVPMEFLERVLEVDPTQPDYQEFLTNRKNEADSALNERLSLQERAGRWIISQDPSGRNWFLDREGRVFCILPTLRDFVRVFIVDLFREADKKPLGWFELLEPLGHRMRTRFPQAAERIDRTLRNVTFEQLRRCPVTFSCLLAKAIYLWAPIVRLGENPTHSKPIIGRTRKAQRGNIHDERYIAAARLCGTLLTRDGEMAKVASCLVEAGLWQGEVMYLPAGKGLTFRDQILSL